MAEKLDSLPSYDTQDGLHPVGSIDRLLIVKHSSSRHLTLRTPAGHTLLTLSIDKPAFFKSQTTLITRGEGTEDVVARVGACKTVWGGKGEKGKGEKGGEEVKNKDFLLRNRKWFYVRNWFKNPEDGREYKIGSSCWTCNLDLVAKDTEEVLGTFKLNSSLFGNSKDSTIGSLDLSPLLTPSYLEKHPEHRLLTPDGTQATKLLETAVVAWVMFRDERRREAVAGAGAAGSSSSAAAAAAAVGA